MLNNHFIQEKIILPLSDIITGNSVSKYLKFLQQSKYWSREQIDDFQNNRLRLLISHVYENVPYYREVMLNLGLTPNDIQTKDDLNKLPILTKEIIKREGIERFTAKNIKVNNTIKRSSSGSTGEPLRYLCTKEAYSVNIAANLRGWYDMGYQLGDRYVKLSGNPRGQLVKRMQDYITCNLYMSTNPLNDDNFNKLLHNFESYKPQVIRCYPDPLLLLAKYKEQNPHLMKFAPLAITTTGNTLHKDTREIIERAFGCKIFDSYSSEGNSCVFECNTHSCYHSTEEYGISEVIDSDGNIINKGVGKLISTDLWNFAHPFLRYDTQDFIEIDDLPCVCGRSHLKILQILGRDNDIITVPSGRRFIVHHFTIFFSSNYADVNKSIDQFQVIKRKDDTILFRFVVNEFFTDTTKSKIKKYWESEFGVSVDIELVSQIIIEHNNKRKFIINE